MFRLRIIREILIIADKYYKKTKHFTGEMYPKICVEWAVYHIGLGLTFRRRYVRKTILLRYDTIEEINVDSKAEYTA